VAKRNKSFQSGLGPDYGPGASLTPRDVADEITLLIEAASMPVPRFDPGTMLALAALAKGLRNGTDAYEVERSLQLLEHALALCGEKMSYCFELILPQLRPCFDANLGLQNDDSDWTKSWCLSAQLAADHSLPPLDKSAKKLKPCSQRTCKREVIRALCQHLNAIGLHFIELRRWRYRSAALNWVLYLVQSLDGSDGEAPSATPARGDLVENLVFALQGSLLGLLKRCPCASLQHVALGTLLRMREGFAHQRAERAFTVKKHVRFRAVHQHMLLGSQPIPPGGHPPFQGADDYPLTAGEYANVVTPEPGRSGAVKPGAIIRALHDTVHHIRVHL
jgi:hypothetical protein